MGYPCKICDKVFDEIPAGAIPVGEVGRDGYQLFLFDKLAHNLLVDDRIAKRTHSLHHKSNQPDCPYCNSGEPVVEEPAPKPEAAPVSEPIEVSQLPKSAPQKQQSQESDDVAESIMQAAFKRVKKIAA